MKPMFLGLQARLMAGLIILVCFTLAIVAYSLLQDSHRQLEKFQHTQAEYQAKSLAEGSLDALVTHDYELLERWVASSLPSKEYAYAALIKPNGLILTHTNIDLIGHKDEALINIKGTQFHNHNYLSRPVLEVIHPAYIGKKHLANAHVAYYLDEEHGFSEESVPLIITAILLSVLALSIGSFIITRKIINPINSLTRDVSNISPDKLVTLDKKVLDRHDEVGALARTFGAISAHLFHSYQQLKHKSAELEERVIERTSELTATNKSLAESEQRISTIVDNIADAVIIVDESGEIESCNNAAQYIFEYSTKELTGKNIQYLFPDLSKKENKFYSIQSEVYETTATKKHGDEFPIEMSVRDIIFDNKHLYTLVMRDITARKAMIDDLKHMADHDPLTGLLNRAYFHDEIERIFDRVKRGNSEPCALLYIDLDNFKYVNDTLGHAAGDRVLIDVTTMLKKRTRKSDVLCRLGGDEFTILIYNTTPKLAEEIANSFRESMSAYVFQEGNETVDVGCSIGISMFTENSKSAELEVSYADFACHQAKLSGRNCVKLFHNNDKELAATNSKDVGWSHRIKDAIEHNKFELIYQPILEVSSQKITTVEVFLRMRDENGELMLPSAFLPSAERFGLMEAVDHWVITHAVENLASMSATLPDLNFSINISTGSIHSGGLYQVIKRALKTHKIKANKLTFEITEKIAVTDLMKAAEQLHKIKAIGCNIALDDFGSGYASFSHLEELPLDTIKIDSSYTRQISQQPSKRKVIFAINQMANTLGINVVAKHVEDKDVYQLLKDNNIKYMQGYYINQPCLSIGELFDIDTLKNKNLS